MPRYRVCPVHDESAEEGRALSAWWRELRDLLREFSAWAESRWKNGVSEVGVGWGEKKHSSGEEGKVDAQRCEIKCQALEILDTHFSCSEGGALGNTGLNSAL